MTRWTILGCGSSAGVPRIGGNWGACDAANPKNRRRRCSALVEHGDGQHRTRVLIDTSPDLREQLLDARTGELDAVVYTHAHADHTHGIDELRAIVLNMRKRMPVWASEATAKTLRASFGYCFHSAPDSAYPPILDLNTLEPNRMLTIEGAGGLVDILPFEVIHGGIRALGFRIGDIAYTPDISGIPGESMDALRQLRCWIVDALRPVPHPSHFSLDDALGWIDRLKPAQAVLTNLHIDQDYETLRQSLPANIRPAYDGMVL